MRLQDSWWQLWRKITLRRHRSELRALSMARRLGPFAIFPIFLNLTYWWFAMILPALVFGTPGLVLVSSDVPGISLVGGPLYLLAGSFYILASIYALAAICIAAPWFFHWYLIAVGLMFGRTAMADKKETDLIAAIDRTERRL